MEEETERLLGLTKPTADFFSLNSIITVILLKSRQSSIIQIKTRITLIVCLLLFQRRSEIQRSRDRAIQCGSKAE
jgi:hypothetical protein